jgi:hypothetical protein
MKLKAKNAYALTVLGGGASVVEDFGDDITVQQNVILK